MPLVNRTFARLEVLPSYFVNRLEELLAGLTFQLAVTKLNATTIQVVAGADDDAAAVVIDGRWRWITAPITRAHPGGAAGTYSIWAVAADNAVVNVPQTNTDNTNYAWDLRITAGAATPTPSAGVVDIWRKLGTLQWDGAQITSIAQTAGILPPPAHASTHVAGGQDALSAMVLAAAAISEVGIAAQRRAGRKLVAADFTDLNLTAPRALWNLGDGGNLLADVSGNGRTLTNKGTVVTATGIEGAASTAALFAASSAQALYIADTGVNDPFRLRTGTWGAWHKSAKRGSAMILISKGTTVAQAYFLGVNNNNVPYCNASTDGTGANSTTAVGATDVNDDRWHHIVGSYDGSTVRIYVDGQLEAETVAGNPALAQGGLFQAPGPFNVGSMGADGSTSSNMPHSGRMDEAFVTADVLSEDQVRLLYAQKIAHGLALTPRKANAMVRRRRRGAQLAAADFPSTPLRLYNLVGDPLAVTDLGSNGTGLTSQGIPVPTSGPDGAQAGAAFLGGGAHYSATDAGLPAGTSTRSYGGWFLRSSVPSAAQETLLDYGSGGANNVAIAVDNNGLLMSTSSSNIFGPFVCDGRWHHVVVVETASATDGVKRKVYLDGRLVVTATTQSSITLAGADRFRIGASNAGGFPWTGRVARMFVHSALLTAEDILNLYNRGSQDLGASPFPVHDLVERIDATNVYWIGDALEGVHAVDLEVAA